MYYWTLLNKPKEELVTKVFDVQKDFFCNNDWIIQIENDKKALDIDKSENDIKTMKKYSFKKIY